MIPAVTVPPRPKGLPMAMIQSPTRAWRGSPNFTNGKGLVPADLEHGKIRGAHRGRPAWPE